MQNHYKDVIDWLENKAITDPSSIEEMIDSNIQIVSAAFDIPFHNLEKLVNRNSFDNLTPEETKIVDFYFKLYRRRMNDHDK